ncbi:MAG: DUF4199 domain-containing protein [Flectobacillus sp.]|uniref:DUF4199 domain-containing protein n=1 Tax=Flectobacillus sp. TaxID=50419 RepID=UPI003B9B741B
MKAIFTEIKWGVYFSIMTLLWMVLEKVVGLHDIYIDKHPIYTNFIAIPAIMLYVFALREKRFKDLGGDMSYKQAVLSGFYITLVVTLLAPLTQWITTNIITPEFFPNVIRYVIAHQMMTKEEALNQFNQKNYIIQSMIGAPIMGMLTTVIVSFFVKGKK